MELGFESRAVRLHSKIFFFWKNRTCIWVGNKKTERMLVYHSVSSGGSKVIFASSFNHSVFSEFLKMYKYMYLFKCSIELEMTLRSHSGWNY